MLIRQNAPVIGASGISAPAPGEWQVSLSARTLVSDDHYRLDEEQVERHQLDTYVVNRQNVLDVTASYAVTRQLGVSVGVPFVNSSWSIPTPLAPPGPRAEQNGRGLGDIMVMTRYMLFSPLTHPRANVVVGGGVKLPTGQSDVVDIYPNLLSGQNSVEKAVDQSVQPGDGGWGIAADVQAFTTVKKFVLFASGTYLANSRDTNDTPSIIVGLGVATPANVDRQVNSVPDQYLVRAGAIAPLGIPGLSGSLAWRVEGLRRYDLIGDSHGFRRPGYELFIEPGLTYTQGRSQLSITVPLGYYRMRKPDPYSGAPGDATFPDYIVLGSYSVRLGRRAPKAPPVLPS